MATRRRYQDGCGVAQALDIIAERWALLVVRELTLGPRRFSDLKDSLLGISPNVLTDRLNELAAAGVLRPARLPPPLSFAVYELTPWGQALEPVLHQAMRWAAAAPAKRQGLPVTPVSVILTLRALFSAEAAQDFSAQIGLRLGGQGFLASIQAGAFSIQPAAIESAEAILSGNPNLVAAALYGELPLDQALEADLLRATGNLPALHRFVGLFPLPPTAPRA